jgi:Fic family protein
VYFPTLMLSHDLTKSPGRYRKGPIYVNDERADGVVYTAPEASDVPALMEGLAATLHTGHGSDPIVRSAMAHLNPVMYPWMRPKLAEPAASAE